MITDHSKANDNLKPIADATHVQWPTQLTGEPKAIYDRLAKLSGPQFNKLYVQTMVQDHQKDAAEYRAESTKVKDPQLKTYVSQTLPVVEQHLNHVRQLQKSSDFRLGLVLFFHQLKVLYTPSLLKNLLGWSITV